MADSDDEKKLKNYFENVQGGAEIVSLIQQFEQGNDDVYSGIKKFVQKFVMHPIGDDADKPSVLKAAKNFANVMHGEKLYTNLTDFVDYNLKHSKPSEVIKNILPGLNLLAKNAGFTEFQDKKYITLNSLMENIVTGELHETKAYEIAEKNYLKDLDEYIRFKEEHQPDEDLTDLKENKEKLAKIVGEFWSDNRDADFAKFYFLNTVNETEIKPYLHEKAEEISEYAKGISEQAKSTGYSESFEGLEKIIHFIGDYVKKNSKTKEVMKHHGDIAPYLIGVEEE